MEPPYICALYQKEVFYLNIMLISENRRILKDISHYFRGISSFHLDIIHSSTSALEAFAETQPECVILDSDVTIPYLSIVHAFRAFAPQCKFIILGDEIQANPPVQNMIYLFFHGLSQETLFDAIDTLRKTTSAQAPARIEHMVLSFGSPVSFQLYHDVYYILYATYIERGRPNRSRLKYRIRNLGKDIQKKENIDVMLFHDMDVLIAFRKSTHARSQSILTYVKRLCSVKHMEDPCYTIFAMEHVPWNHLEETVNSLQKAASLSYFFPGQIIAYAYIEQHRSPLSLLTVNLYCEKILTSLLHGEQEQALQLVSDLLFHHIKVHMDAQAIEYFYQLILRFCMLVLEPFLPSSVQFPKNFPTIYEEFKFYEENIPFFCSSMRKMHLSNISVRAVEYIFQNHAAEISLSSAADALQITKEYLSHVFKKDLKRTFLDFMQTAKIQQTTLYLQFTDLKVYEIAAAVGYRDAQYFSRLFKKFTGTSPEQYRNTIRGIL